MKIYAPNKQANGIYASVLFVDGVGETDNPRLIDLFRTHGYALERVEKILDVSTNELHLSNEQEIIDTSEPDFENMTPNELRQWAIENGYGSKIRNLRNKEKLLEILRG